MIRTLVAGLLAVLAGCVAQEFNPPVATQGAGTATETADAVPGWMPSQEPLDGTPITPVESVGASRTE